MKNTTSTPLTDKTKNTVHSQFNKTSNSYGIKRSDCTEQKGDYLLNNINGPYNFSMANTNAANQDDVL